MDELSIDVNIKLLLFFDVLLFVLYSYFFLCKYKLFIEVIKLKNEDVDFPFLDNFINFFLTNNNSSSLLGD